jgi:hypothetical protein
MLLHWMQTRWMTELTTAPDDTDLIEAAEGEATGFSEAVSVDMGGF